jgi:peptidyl-prolyl cis-trans isomerase SurA
MNKKSFIVFLLSVLLFSEAEAGILLDKVVAIVNKEVITWSDLYKAMEFEAPDEVKAMKEEEKRRFFREKEETFLENLIDLTLQLQEASKIGITASEEDINKAIEGIKKKYSLSDEQLRVVIQNEGYTFEQYKKKLAEQIIIGRLVDQEIKSKIIISEQDIDSYLVQNKEFLQSEGFNISHIFLKASQDKKEVEDRAWEIYKKIRSGESFSDLARQYSEDKSARTGGELGFIKKSDLSEEFLNILSKMQVGDISEPFWSRSGIHIIKLNERREFKNQQDLRESIKKRLSEERLEKEYKQWVKGLRERAYIEVKL